MRGGLGFVRRFEILSDDVTIAPRSDRFHHAPEGLSGGKPGSMASCAIKRGNQVISPWSKDKAGLREGDIVTLSAGGGSGYGPPSGRDPAARERDRLEGYVTA
jgi:N-methylhydantoinase B